MNEPAARHLRSEVTVSIVGAAFGLILMVACIFLVQNTWTDAFTARDKQLCTGSTTQGCVVKEQALLIKVYGVVSSEFEPMDCAADLRLKDGTVRERVGVTRSVCKENPNDKAINKTVTIHRWEKDTLLEVTIDGTTIEIYEGPRYSLMFYALGAWLGYLVVLGCITRAVYLGRTGKTPRSSSMVWPGSMLLVAVIMGLVINASPGFASLLIPLALGMAVFELYTRQTKEWNER